MWWELKKEWQELVVESNCETDVLDLTCQIVAVTNGKILEPDQLRDLLNRVVNRG